MSNVIKNIRYAISEISERGNEPYWWRQRFNSRIAGPALDYMYRNSGVNYMSRDWDNLLILDACRADMFEQTFESTQFDEYESVHSIGCSSPEWMRETFQGKEYPDTVYVTANPWISKIAPDSFHHVENLWLRDSDVSQEDLESASVLEEAGLGDIPTIYPDMLSEAARDLQEEYPDKRMIVHYFQPHAPCVGNPDGSRKDELVDEMHPGDDLKNGNVTRKEVWEAYVDNLRYAFHYAEELSIDLEGRSVFTADHGELFGEWLWPFPVRGYAHPDGVRHPKLTEVPWAVVEHGERREITVGSTSHHEANENEVNERLKNLGYKI